MATPPNALFLSWILWMTRLSLCLATLIAASAFDLTRREVPDVLWTVMAPPMALLTALWLLRNPGYTWLALLSILLAALLAALIYYTGLMGGADAKALVVVALACPLNGPWTILPGHLFTPLATFSNALFLSVLMAICLFVRNLAWKAKTGLPLFKGLQAPLAVKVLVMLTGFKMRSQEVLEGRKHVFPLEVIREDGSRELTVALKIDAFYERLDELREISDSVLLPDYIWVSPGLPMIVFITVGFLLAFFLGDLLFSAILALIRVFLA